MAAITKQAVPRQARRTRGFAPWVLLKGTVAICMRYRVTGLAAEGAFFAVLSLPPLVFGLAGSLGYVIGVFGVETAASVKAQIVELARQALTEDSVQRVIVPTLDAVLDQGRADIISIGFILALWSGSRALNVFVDTISIMYGMGGRRGIIKTRALSFTMYVIVLAAGVVVLPLVLAGPALVDQLLPDNLDFLNALYWPAVVLSTSLFLTTLYHLAVPERTPWRHDLPGAFLSLAMWIAGSYLLRYVLAESIGGTSIYGPLAAPIAVLLWLYLIVISLLIGAAFNASLDQWLRSRRMLRSVASPLPVSNVGPDAHPDPGPDPNAGQHPDTSGESGQDGGEDAATPETDVRAPADDDEALPADYDEPLPFEESRTSERP
jgi:membrane protein